MFSVRCTMTRIDPKQFNTLYNRDPIRCAQVAKLVPAFVCLVLTDFLLGNYIEGAVPSFPEVYRQVYPNPREQGQQAKGKRTCTGRPTCLSLYFVFCAFTHLFPGTVAAHGAHSVYGLIIPREPPSASGQMTLSNPAVPTERSLF